MGICMAVEVKNKASVCILIRSLHEIVRGDRFVMRTGKGGRHQPDRRYCCFPTREKIRP